MSHKAGRYVLGGELGAGGMGAVHRAHDSAGREVAFKQLRSAAAGPKRRMLEALFEREYHTLVRLKHPRIIEVYDYGFTEAGPYYTMELLDGEDLQELAPLPARVACRHLRDVASSLALLHAHRLVHRDVSPRNVRLTSDGRAKLIDFGALSSFGTASEIVGTAPCMAPEVLRRWPLDQRTDLYALGAIGYWALTGRHAYPERHTADLPRAWQQPPRPLSQLAPDVPPALEALIMSLLSLDPLARPASAAAVIDQLTAIAELEPEPYEQAAASYLSSGKLVGRNDEQQWLRDRLVRALAGHGAELLIEGASGIGKTRLVHELSLEAQLKGAVVLRADALASSRAFGIVMALALQLLGTCPELARRAAGRDAALLAHLSPELASQLAVVTPETLSEDPAERRARFQTALHTWFLAAAAEQTLVIVVDNAQAADDNSAAFVAALGHEARHMRLLVLVTQTTGDSVVASVPLAALRKRSARLKLGGLGRKACEELVGSLFGNAANTGRLAKLLFEKSGGNPQHCMDLAQLLVKKKIAKYVDGAWVLPLEIASGELPGRVEELLAQKLAALRPEARGLCEALSIHAQRVSIERCLALAEGTSEADAYLALDELVVEQILLVEDGSYGFRGQALRESVLNQVPAERRRALHLRAAEALLAEPEAGVGLRMEAAWLLLHAGEEVRGADIMAGATRELLRHQGVESVEQIVQGIDAALVLYEKQKRSKYEIASLLFPLMSLAFFVDWRVTLRHGERAIELGLDITGL
ncbi:MAG TPA: protein kinase, partial [Polyangiales bacterium]|nr:protein kinase [Polyangiales bacterium]